MALNLRLSDDLAEDLRERSRETGVSQQEILRRALERFLHAEAPAPPASGYRANLLPARRPFHTATERLTLPRGVSSEALLDRDDRI